MKTDFSLRLAWRLHKIASVGRIRLWLILFLFHQFITIPLLFVWLAVIWSGWESPSESLINVMLAHREALFVALGVSLVLLNAVCFSLGVLYIRRQIRKRRDEATAAARFEEFRDACFAYRDKMGNFPTTLKELGTKVDRKYGNPLYNLEFRLLSPLDIGVIASSAPPWRAPFAPWGFGLRTLVALEDGAIVKVRGRRAVNSFYNVVLTAEMGKSVGRFYQMENELRFERHDATLSCARIIEKIIFLTELSLVFGLAFFLCPNPAFDSFTIIFLGRFVEIPSAVVSAICLIIGLIPLPILPCLLTIGRQGL